MNINILHLDNDSKYATDLTLKLLSLGIMMDHTTSEKEAIDLIMDRRYEVLICELDLTILPGAAFIRAAKAIHPALIIMVTSKSGETKEMEDAFAAGASEYFVKEITDHKICDRIAQHLAASYNQNFNKQ